MFKHVLLMIAAIQIFDTNFICSSPITRVMRHNLGAYVWEDEEWPNEPFGDYLNRCMEYQGNMQPFKKCRSAWNILDRYYESAETHSNHVIGNDPLTWQNLQLLRNENDEERTVYLANLVDRTSTEIGRVTLRSWIARPTDDISILLQRQASARYFLEHQELFQKLDQHLKDFQKSENFLMSFWVNDPLKQAASRNYFSFSRFPALEDKLNSSTTVMTLSGALGNQRRILSFLTVGFAAALLPVYGAARLVTDPSGTIFDKLSNRLIGAGGPIFGLLSFLDNRYLQSGGFMAAGAYCAMNAQSEYEWARDNLTLNMFLQIKLQHIANCLHSLEAIGELLHQHSELKFVAEKDLHSLVQNFKTQDAVTRRLFRILNSKTFHTTPSRAGHWGRILVAYRLMHQSIDKFEPLLCTLGEVDAYMSVARLYQEFENSRVRYSFANYVPESSHPVLVLDKLWSPFIDPSIVVPNSIALGATPAMRNLVITGPNEGGKSTFVRTVATSLILAQSLGIAPASEITVAPFSYIATYLNITDSHGTSLFEAQVQRAKQILDHIDGMDKNKYSFVIIDELFNGTDARVGQATSYSIANYLSQNPQVVSIFPTHFPELTQLEENGHSMNYRVLATVDPLGKISYPFIVEQGASKQNIVLDIMRNEGFNPAIIDQAAERLKS